MPGRTPAAASRSFIEPLEAAIACLAALPFEIPARCAPDFAFNLAEAVRGARVVEIRGQRVVFAAA